MLPLISEHTFNELRKKRDAIPGSAQVFVPVAEDNPQLFFIGQATKGKMFEGTYISVAQVSYRLLEKYKFNPGRSGFLRALRSITDQCRRIVSPNGTLPSVGWSNLCKIGDSRKNPTPQSVHAQADLCVRALREELQKASPSITLLLTGDFARDEILYPVFGEKGWRNNVADENLVAVKDHPQYGVVLWGYHPQCTHGMVHQHQLLSFMAGFAAARLL